MILRAPYQHSTNTEHFVLCVTPVQLLCQWAHTLQYRGAIEVDPLVKIESGLGSTFETRGVNLDDLTLCQSRHNVVWG
jgi:hypothetical protein